MDKELYTLAHGLYEHLERAKTDAALIYGFYEALEKAYALGVTDHVDDARAQARAEGRDEGIEDGYIVGFEHGKDASQDRGYNKGYDAGWDDGWDDRGIAAEYIEATAVDVTPQPVDHVVTFMGIDFAVDLHGNCAAMNGSMMDPAAINGFATLNLPLAAAAAALEI